MEYRTLLPDVKKGDAASRASLKDDGPSHCMPSKIRYFEKKSITLRALIKSRLKIWICTLTKSIIFMYIYMFHIWCNVFVDWQTIHFFKTILTEDV